MPQLSPEDDGHDADRGLIVNYAARCSQYLDLLPGLMAMRDDAFAAATLSRAFAEMEKAREAMKPIVEAIKARAKPKGF